MDPLPPLYPIVDPGPPGADPLPALELLAAAILRGGAGIIQLRMKQGDDGWGTGALFAAARRLRRLTHEAGARLVVNDRVDVAILADADGVHVGQEDLPLAEARRLVGAGRLIGVSTHSLEEALAAEAGGADYIGFGPMYPTPSKANARPRRSLETLREVREAVHLPIVAIGGITAARVTEVREAGADSVAVISAIASAPDPTAATRELLRLARGEA